MNRKLGVCGSLLLVVNTFGQNSTRPSDDLRNRAVQEFRNNDWPAAERDFQELVKGDPSNIFANMYLGQTLFRQERYGEAATFFQKTRDLQKSGKQLNTTQERILTDQLVMSYGITGEMKKAHALLDEAIKKDPEYPLNYYNRACAFAEEGDKARRWRISIWRSRRKRTSSRVSRCQTLVPTRRFRSTCAIPTS